MSLYDIAREVTDTEFGAGTYAEINHSNQSPEIAKAVGDSNRAREDQRRERTAKRWRDHEIRWNKLYGRPMKPATRRYVEERNG